MSTSQTTLDRLLALTALSCINTSDNAPQSQRLLNDFQSLEVLFEQILQYPLPVGSSTQGDSTMTIIDHTPSPDHFPERSLYHRPLTISSFRQTQ